MKPFLSNTKKPIIFALVAGLGCLIAAIIAEPLFIRPPLRYSPPPAPAPVFCLTFDDSQSMSGQKRNDVKQAAKNFVNKRDLEKEKIGLVVFSSSSRIQLPLSRDKSQVLAAIDSYYDGGGTSFTLPLQHSIDIFQNDPDVSDAEKRVREINEKIGEQNNRDAVKRRNRMPIPEQSVSKIVLFFTDGANSDQASALQKAQELREKGILLFAVATMDGDKNYLTQMTGDASRVFMTSDQNIADTFKKVEQEIEKIAPSQGNLLTGKQSGDREEFSRIWNLIQAVLWSGLLCFGMALTLIAAQNHFLRKPLFPTEQIIAVAIASLLAGFVAGGAGQLTYSVFGMIRLGELARLVAWTILGALLARGTLFFIPNLNAAKAWQFGALGGFLGVIGYWVMAFLLGEMGGRWLGAFILGAAIGLLVAFVETFYRNVWLMVVYDPRNITQVNLGSQTVTLGSGKYDTIFIPDVPEQAGRFHVVGDTICYTDVHGTQSLAAGGRLQIGPVELVVCSKDVQFSASKFYPMKMSTAKKLQQREGRDND
ncbi:MAG: VWA domain-containing protein [Thermoguttaceae bacterium]